MGEGFVKLFSAILDSSVWSYDSDTRIVWITLLTMADSEGRVHAAIPGIANRARVPLDVAERSLELFQAPDPHSRSDAYEGRRIAKDGRDWVILNFQEHRRRQLEEAERARKRRWWRANRGKSAKLDAKLDNPSENSRNLANDSTKTRPIQRQRHNNNNIYSADFEKFWEAYPKARRKGKKAAYKAWQKAEKDGLPDIDTVLKAIESQKKDRQWQDSQFIPLPTTWINQGRWDDEIENQEDDEWSGGWGD